MQKAVYFFQALSLAVPQLRGDGQRTVRLSAHGHIAQQHGKIIARARCNLWVKLLQHARNAAAVRPNQHGIIHK